MMFQLEYATARVRVMRSKLLSDEAVSIILDSGSMAGIVSALSGTMYEPLFESDHGSGSDFLVQLRGLLFSSEKKIMSFLPKDLRDDFYKIILRHEVDNAKKLLRGVSSGFSKEEIIMDLYPKGIVFDKASSSFPLDFNQAVMFFKEIPYLGDKLLLDYRFDNIYDIERQIDKAYFQVLKGIQNPLFHDYVRYRALLVDRLLSLRGEIHRTDVTPDLFVPVIGNTSLNYSEMDKLIMDKANKYVLNDAFGVGLYLNYLIRLERDVNVISASVERLSYK